MIDQGELFSIPSPCKGVCTSNSRGYCRGCLRSRQERFHWNEFTAFQQQLIVNLCEKRRLKIIAARDGLSDDEDFGEAPDQQDLFVAEVSGAEIQPANDADITPVPKEITAEEITAEEATPAVVPPEDAIQEKEPTRSAIDQTDSTAPSSPSSDTRTSDRNNPPPPGHPGDQFDLF